MKQKITEWTKRYLPAEILSIIITLITAGLVFNITNNQLTTALAGTWAGNIAYFGYILVSDILISIKKCKLQSINYTGVSLLKNLRALALEFGFAELIDSLFIRPALMYYFPIWLNNLYLGIFLAKIAADITFYIPAITSYELNKRYLSK